MTRTSVKKIKDRERFTDDDRLQRAGDSASRRESGEGREYWESHLLGESGDEMRPDL